MSILAQFLLRLTFGLAVGMGITSPRQVTFGYFRNHLFVALGLSTLATLILAQSSQGAAGLALVTAVLSYVGTAAWLYGAQRFGKVILWLVAASSLGAALVDELTIHTPNAISVGTTSLFASATAATALRAASVVSSGLVLGITLAAMLLGHWYLNAPGMELAPLRRLLIAIALAVGMQLAISAFGLIAENARETVRPSIWGILMALRWFWLVGVLPLVWMAWKTLDIPNTQSATGILYVAVIGVFVGELAALLLSAESTFPL